MFCCQIRLDVERPVNLGPNKIYRSTKQRKSGVIWHLEENFENISLLEHKFIELHDFFGNTFISILHDLQINIWMSQNFSTPKFINCDDLRLVKRQFVIFSWTYLMLVIMMVQNWHLIIKPLDNKVQKYFRISKNARTKRNDDGKN